MSKIKVAIIGIGNCASSLIQGVEYYQTVDEDSGFVPGIINNKIGDYLIRDIEFVAAFDVNKNKVGKDISEAIFSQPNCASKLCDVPRKGVEVLRGPLLDGLEGHLKNIISVDSNHEPVNVTDVLIDSGAEILINYLPTGSKLATEFYIKQSLAAECGFINGIPEPVASTEKWRTQFASVGLPLAGDDIKSQLGATTLNRCLIDLFIRSGVRIKKSFQSNIGNNADFLNLSDENRGISKNICKINAIKNLIPYPANVTVEIKNDSSLNLDCNDAKQVFMHIEGEHFGSRSMSINIEMCVEDSPNGAGAMVDVIRAMKIAADRGDSGAINSICARHFKNPPKPCKEGDAILDWNDYLKIHETIGDVDS